MLNLDNFLLYVFPIILNNTMILLNIFFDCVLIICSWRDSRNENVRNTSEKYLRNLKYFCIFVFVYTIISMIYVLFDKIIFGNHDDYFSEYFEGKYYLYNIIVYFHI